MGKPVLTEDQVEAIALRCGVPAASVRKFRRDRQQKMTVPEQGDWNALYATVRAILAAAEPVIRAEEREACIAALLAVKDKSGINADGGAWLQRAGRGDYIGAIRSLGAASKEA